MFLISREANDIDQMVFLTILKELFINKFVNFFFLKKMFKEIKKIFGKKRSFALLNNIKNKIDRALVDRSMILNVYNYYLNYVLSLSSVSREVTRAGQMESES